MLADNAAERPNFAAPIDGAPSMMPRNGTSDHWIEELYWWMESCGLTHP
jgi:hypothetical protein